MEINELEWHMNCASFCTNMTPFSFFCIKKIKELYKKRLDVVEKIQLFMKCDAEIEKINFSFQILPAQEIYIENFLKALKPYKFLTQLNLSNDLPKIE